MLQDRYSYMMPYYYDLHVHSCLSPCSDDDMTPGNIAGMSALKGLQIVALTDHNTCRNCPAFFAEAKKCGIIPVAGMELTTAEDIHIVCLFEYIEDAMRFDAIVYEHLLNIKNRADIFGNQILMDVNDTVSGEEEKLLISATDFDIKTAIELARGFGAFVYPAHIDRQSGGIVAVLGDIPQEYGFSFIELNDGKNLDMMRSKIVSVRDAGVIVSSDAHHLWDISEAENFIVLDDEPYSSVNVRHKLFEYLKGH